MAASDDKKEDSSMPKALANPAKFVLDTKINDVALPSITKFSLKTENDAKKIDAAFNAVAGILNKRKTECMSFANESIAAYKLAGGKGKGAKNKGKGNNNSKNDPSSPKKPKSETLIVDIDHTKYLLSELGSKLGELRYYLYNEEKALVTKTREYMYFEDFNIDAKKQLLELNNVIDGELTNLDKEKQAYKDSLQTVLPRLRSAEKSLKGITKNDMNEFRGLRSPARIIISVIKIIAMMLGEITITNEKHFREWKDLKKIINIELIEKMLSFDFDINNKDQIINRNNIDEKWCKKKDITMARAKQVSPLAGKLMDWLEATIELSRMRETVAPQEKKIDALSIKKRGKENQAKKLQKMIDDNDKKMSKLHGEMKKLVYNINALRDEITKTVNGREKAAADKAANDKAY